MGRLFILIFAVLVIPQNSLGLKILNLFPVISKSHNILGEGINRHLLNAGHEVTYVTTMMRNNTHPKLRQIDVSANYDMVSEETVAATAMNKKTFAMHEKTMIGMYMITAWTVTNENFKKLLNDPKEQFDVVIVDFSVNEITYSGIAKLYNAPLIWVGSMEPNWMISKMIDEALHPAYSSDMMSLKLPPFSFWKRASELFTQLKVTFFKETIYHFFDSRLYYNEIAPIIKSRGMEPPSPMELRYNASLVISNSHVSFGQAHRLPMNYISVAGFHIDEKSPPLPENIKKIMDNAKHGVIYFSMGSLLRSTSLPEVVKDSLIQMFGTLKQTVIWKFEEDRTGLPKNVHIMKWAPQQSILAHPNCVLFITHGGLLSTTESIHHGVPVIGIPAFADQYVNIERAVEKGFAKQVDLVKEPKLANDLKEAIDEVLGDPKYTEKVKQLSFIFHHRPIKPGDEIVHWVEHVALTGGAPHLRSAALLVPWYQKVFLDLALVILIFVFSGLYLYKNLIRPHFCKKTQAKKNKSN